MSAAPRLEHIVDRWSTLVDAAAGQVERLAGDLEDRLLAADIPGGCFWEVSPGSRDSVQLVVRIRTFPDFRVFLRAREYGTHVHVSRIVTLDPSWIKRQCAVRIYGDPFALSIPHTMLGQQELSAWIAVVHRSLLASIDALGNDRGRRRGGVLQIRRTDRQESRWE